MVRMVRESEVPKNDRHRHSSNKGKRNHDKKEKRRHRDNGNNKKQESEKEYEKSEESVEEGEIIVSKKKVSATKKTPTFVQTTLPRGGEREGPKYTYSELNLLPPKDFNFETYTKDWCKYCGARFSSNFTKGPWGPRTLCTVHYI